MKILEDWLTENYPEVLDEYDEYYADELQREDELMEEYYE